MTMTNAPLDALIVEARAKGMWLWFEPHDVWRSPDELAVESASFRQWGPEYWKLRDPKERITQTNQVAATQASGGLKPWFIAALASIR
jgi:hypothetical protein